MARTTLAQANARIAALEAALEAKDAELAHFASRIKHDYVERAEYNRVQGVLRSTQGFLTKYKNEARPRVNTSKPFGERCRAYLEATGEKSVTSTRLVEWEQAQAAH